MKHEINFSTSRDIKRINTECIFDCSCHEWKIEVPIPDVMMNAFDGRGFGVHLVNMGIKVGRRFETHIRDGTKGYDCLVEGKEDGPIQRAARELKG